MTRRRLAWLVGGLAALGMVVAIGPSGTAGPPLDPRSTGPLGLRGLLDVLDVLGVDVEVAPGVPDADVAVALVVQDRMTDEQRKGVAQWAADGGRLVLADPLSPLAPDVGGLTSIGFTEPTIEPRCEDPVVEDVDRVAILDGVVFARPDEGTGCFPRSGGVWMVREPLGAGEQVSLGGALTLTNDLLDDADTAVFLVALLTPPEPTAGGGEDDPRPAGVRLVVGDDPDGSGESLADVLPDQVALALAQVPLAWLALLWWRGRRHGRPVGEQPPVRLEASETTVAVGNLLQRAGRSAEAADRIRAHVATDLQHRLGLPPMPAPDLAAAAAQRTGLPLEDLQRVLGERPADDRALVAWANLVGRVRQALHTDGTPPPADPSPDTPPRSDPPRTDPEPLP